MEKQKKKTIQMPHTYVIIFAVVVVCALLTYLIPVGSFQTQDISYMVGDTEKTRTVIVADSFSYAMDEAGNRVRNGVPLFGTEDFGGQGMLMKVTPIAEALESIFHILFDNPEREPAGAALMFCRHCLRYSMGWCPRHGGTESPFKEPYYLSLPDGRRFRLAFDCKHCQMIVYADEK